MHSAAEGRFKQEVAEEWMAKALHDLCQPLSALQCRLALATLNVHGTEPMEREMRQAIEDGLRQCDRVIAGVRAMQQYLDGNN